MARSLKTGLVYVLIGLFLLLVALCLTLAIDQAIRLISLYQVSSHAGGPDLLRLRQGLGNDVLPWVVVAAVLFLVVFTRPGRLLPVSVVAALVFLVLNLFSGRHVLPEAWVPPSAVSLSERYVQALAANDEDAALRLTDGSDECVMLTTQVFRDDQALLRRRLGDDWPESGIGDISVIRFTTFYDQPLPRGLVIPQPVPQQLASIMAETGGGDTFWVSLKMSYTPFLGTRYICGEEPASSSVWSAEPRSQVSAAGTPGPVPLTDTPSRVLPIPTPTLAAAATTRPAGGIRLVGHIGGVPRAVFGQGNTIYLGIGAELGILDVSDPTHPQRIGYVALPDVPTDINVVGDYAYVTAGQSGLHVVDVSTPWAPVTRGATHTPMDARGVLARGNIAYVAAGEMGLGVFDVSEPSSPTELLFHDIGEVARDMVIVRGGDYLFVTNRPGLSIVDVSNPRKPVTVGQYHAPEPVVDVAVVGSYAYVADAAALRVIDISDPSHPTEKSVYATSQHMNMVYAGQGPGCRTTSVVGEGGYAYVDGCAGNLVLDVSNPALPTLVGSSEGIDGYVGLVMDGYAYIIGPSGLRVLDISYLAAPRAVGSYQAPAWFYDMAVADTYVYVAEYNNGLRVLDVSDPMAPVEVGFYQPPPLGYVQGVAVQGNYVYAADGAALRVVDVSDPTTPVEVGSSSIVKDGLSEGFWRVDAVDNYVYMVGSDDTLNLWVVDVSNPTAPVKVGTLSLPREFAQDIVVMSQNAYIVGNTGLHVVDVSEPTAPAKVGGYSAQGLWSSVAVANNMAYLGAMYPDDLRVIDISDPTALVEVGRYTPPGDGRGVAVAGPFAYVLDEYHSGLRVVDVSDPTHPIEVAFHDLPNPTHFDGIAVSNHTVYAGAGMAGLYILQYSPEVE
jgi:hypothetical protein